MEATKRCFMQCITVLSLILFAGIIPLAEAQDCSLALVPQSGQTGCWDSAGNSIACAGTGQDGEYKNGFAWPSQRFTDNSDGTVTDNLTGLIWLKNANCTTFYSGDSAVQMQNARTWTYALKAANLLGHGYCDLTDGSSAEDWRLPNVRELASLFDYSQSSPALPLGHPFGGVQLEYYWSSSSYGTNPNNYAIISHLRIGTTMYGYKIGTYYYVWPVRDSGAQSNNYLLWTK